MKTTKNDSHPASDPAGFLQASNSNGDEIRFAQLRDLAKDGDETAAAELELIFA